MSDSTDQLAGMAAAGAQAGVNNGQQQQVNFGGTQYAQGLVIPVAGGLAFLAHASQIHTNNGQVGSPTPTTGGGRNLFGETPSAAGAVKRSSCVGH